MSKKNKLQFIGLEMSLSGTSAIVVLGGQIGLGVESTDKRVCQLARDLPMLNINIPFLPPHRKAWLVGGAVRDFLRGETPFDLDIIVAENTHEYARELAFQLGTRAVELGKPPHCIYRITKEKRVFDIVNLNGKSIEEDLLKRDFSINAMAYDLSQCKLIDITNGRRDLLQKKIRMVSSTVFIEDPLRLLRAFRLAATFNFDIDRQAQTTITQQVNLINKSAAERIQAELCKIFDSTNTAMTIKAMDRTGLLEQIFPEVTHLKNVHGANSDAPNPYAHTVSALTCLEELLHLPKKSPQFSGGCSGTPLRIRHPGLLKLAALLHDIGRPHLPPPASGHRQQDEAGSKKGAEMADKIIQRLAFSNHQRHYITFIIGHQHCPSYLLTPYEPHGINIKSAVKFFRMAKKYTPDILLHAVAKLIAPLNCRRQDLTATSQLMRNAENILNCYYNDFIPASKHPPLITGRDLITIFKLPPSPLFKTVLSTIEEARLCGHLTNKADAIKWTKSFLNQNINWSGS